MPTIRDIAARAAVSPATVSRFLSGRLEVKEDTRRRIEEAVQAFDYKPNYLARSLTLKATQTIAVVIPDILNPYYSGLARGVEDEAQKMGWSVLLCNTDNRVDKELSYLQMLEYKHVDGIILVAAGGSGEHLQGLLERKLAIVLASRRVEGVEADTVAVANTQGAYEATRHLISLGHRRIAIIAGDLSLPTSRERLEGYRQALVDAGLPVDESLVGARGDFHHETGATIMKAMLRQRHAPTAVFAASDTLALGAINAVQTQGKVVPNDVAIVGFDGIPLGQLVKPRLTTIMIRPYWIGKTACRMLLDRVVRKKNPPPRMAVAEARLLVRESCGASLSR